MKEFVKAKRKDASKVHVLTWHLDREEQSAEEFGDMKAFCRELPDMMTTHYLIITVVADGKPLSEQTIEKLKQQALKELQGMPISHAKALLKM